MTNRFCEETGKIKYKNPHAAHRVVNALMRKPGRDRMAPRGQNLMTYRCALCQQYHVGHGLKA